MGTMPENATTVVRKTNGVVNIGTAGLDKVGVAVNVRAMPIWKMILVRVLRTYLSTFLGLLTIDASGIVDMQVAGTLWGTFATTAVIAAAPALVSLLHNAVDFLTMLDVKGPEWRA
jgi:hypothetical protein